MKPSLCFYHYKGKGKTKKQFKCEFSVHSKDGKDVDYDTMTDDEKNACADEFTSKVGNN